MGQKSQRCAFKTMRLFQKHMNNLPTEHALDKMFDVQH